MKRILIPTDFSKNADHALKFAINLCDLLNAELIVFHSCEHGGGTLNEPINNLYNQPNIIKPLP